MENKEEIVRTPTGDAAGLSVTMDRTPWITFNRWSFATKEDWECVCELAGVDPSDEDQEIKLYVCAIEVVDND